MASAGKKDRAPHDPAVRAASGNDCNHDSKALDNGKRKLHETAGSQDRKCGLCAFLLACSASALINRACSNV